MTPTHQLLETLLMLSPCLVGAPLAVALFLDWYFFRRKDRP